MSTDNHVSNRWRSRLAGETHRLRESLAIPLGLKTQMKTVCLVNAPELPYSTSTPSKSFQPKVAASIITVRMTANINNKQQAFDLAFLWYLAALLSSTSAPLACSLVTSTLFEIKSSCSPCSVTMCATSRKSSFSSVTPCSIFRISASRSTINESWKSTSSCEASRSCSCDCCCPN